MRVFLYMLSAMAAGWMTMQTAGAQTARVLRFEPSVIEIDTVRYDAGPVRVRFTCTNICDKDVVITDVHSMCGCAVPSFSKAAIRPGAQGHVDVVLDPSHLFAEQNRHLTVIATNGDYRKFNTITIHGYVSRDQTEEEIRYPHELLPGLRSDAQPVGMRLSRRGDVSVREFTLYNTTERPLVLFWTSRFRNITAELPAMIEPHQSARARVSVNTWNIPCGAYTEFMEIWAGGEMSTLWLKGAVE